MNKLSMCRICMIKNVRMHDIINTNLQEIYEKLTAMPFVSNDNRPLQVCYICHARLQNCCQLRKCCLKSEQLFTRVLKTNGLELLQNVNTIGKTERMVIWCSARKDHRGFDNDLNEQTDGITHVQVKIEEIDDNDQIHDLPIQSEDNLDVDNMNVDERIQEESNSPLVTSDTNAVSQSIEVANSTSTSDFRIEANKSTPSSELVIEANKSIPTSDLHIEANKSTPTSELYIEANKSTPTSELRIEANKLTPSSELRIEANKSIPTSNLHIEANKSTPTSELSIEANKSTPTSELRIEANKSTPSSELRIEANKSIPTSDLHIVANKLTPTSELRIEANKSTPTSELRIEANKSTLACELCTEANKSTPTSELRTGADNSTSTSDNSIANNSEETRQTTEPLADVSLGVDETVKSNCLTTNLRHSMRSESAKVLLHTMDIDKSNGSQEDCHSPLLEHNYSNVTKDTLNSQSASFFENANPVQVEDNPRFIDSSRLRQKKFDLNKTVANKSHIKHEVTTDKKIKKSSKIRLKKHNNDLLKKIGVHSTDKIFQCPTCAKCCGRKDAFIIHLRIHTGERPYKCSLCSKSFSRKDVLTSHIRSHTGEKPYKCDVCEKRFVQKCDLVRHIQIHSGEKPYMCNICEKCFNKKGNLTKHVRIHTGENPYKCDKCKKRFAQKSTLTRHIRIHTPTGVK